MEHGRQPPAHPAHHAHHSQSPRTYPYSSASASGSQPSSVHNVHSAIPHPGPGEDRDRKPPASLSPRVTTLPSIHQLHPGLPSHLPPMTSPQQYIHPQSLPASSLGTRKPPDDSDPDEPPKKKRRRQALSCTECKRRKIKCDRQQPCGPCSRRGEQQKCQWHIIEPMEKYVTRAEYDELKSRVDELEAMLQQVAPNVVLHHTSQVAGPSSTMHLTPGPQTDPIQGTQITPYHQAPITTGPGIYHGAHTPSRSSARGDPSSSPHSRVALPPRSPVSYSRQQTLPPVPPQSRPMPSAQPQNPPPPPRSSSISPTVSSSSRIQPHPPPTSSTAAQASTAVSRRASLSVPNLISPNPPDMVSQNQQSKNLRAQAPLPLGPRLRNTSPTGSAPPRSYPHPLPPITSPIAVGR